MALQKQVISIPLTGGVDTKTDPVLVSKDKLARVENYLFGERGTMTRREAWVALADSAKAGAATAARLAVLGKQLVVTAGAGAYTWKPGDTAWAGVGLVPVLSARREKISTVSGTHAYSDACTSGGYTCYVWTAVTSSSTRSTRFSIVEEATGAIIQAEQVLTSDPGCTRPRVCVVGSSFVITYVISTGGTTATYYVRTVPIIGGTVTAQTAISAGVTDLEACYDVVGGASYALMVRIDSSASSLLAVLFDGNGALTSTSVELAATLPKANIQCVSLTAFSDTKISVLVGHTGTTVRGYVITRTATTLSSVTAAATVSVPAPVFFIGGALYNGLVYAFSAPTRGAAIDAERPVKLFTHSDTNTFSLTSTARMTNPQLGPVPAGKPFFMGGSLLIPWVTISGSGTQAALFIEGYTTSLSILGAYATSAAFLVASACHGIAADINFHGFLPTPQVLGDGTVRLAVQELGRVTGATTAETELASVRLAYNTFTPENLEYVPLGVARLGDSLFYPGALPQVYDGLATLEAGFCVSPETLTAAAPAGGGSMTAGDSQVCAVYEFYDNSGRRHQSMPSPSIDLTVTANQRVNLTIPTLLVGGRAAVASVAVYRTTVGGGTFFRDSPLTTPTPNDTSTQSVIYTVTKSDTSLEQGEILYNATNVDASGQALFNAPPPPCRGAVPFQERLFVWGLENPYEIRYSQKLVPNLGLHWSDALSIRVPEGSGEPTALGVLDDKLIVFTPTRKFVLVGSGPDQAGANGSYELHALPGNVGCIEPRSVYQTQSGLVYQSLRGIYVLDRGLTDNYIGAAVERDVQGYKVVSVLPHPSLSQIRFTLSTGEILVYDPTVNEWSRLSSSVYSCGPAVYYDGKYTFLDIVAENIVQDAAGTYLDAGTTPIVGLFTTPWIRGGAISGFQRVWRLLAQFWKRSDSAVTVNVYVNYDDSAAVETFSIPSTAAEFGSQIVSRLMKFHLAHQKVSAIKFQFVDTPTVADGGKGSEFSALTLEIGTKRGAAKIAGPTGEPGV